MNTPKQRQYYLLHFPNGTSMLKLYFSGKQAVAHAYLIWKGFRPAHPERNQELFGRISEPDRKTINSSNDLDYFTYTKYTQLPVAQRIEIVKVFIHGRIVETKEEREIYYYQQS